MVTGTAGVTAQQKEVTSCRRRRSHMEEREQPLWMKTLWQELSVEKYTFFTGHLWIMFKGLCSCVVRVYADSAQNKTCYQHLAVQG